MNRGDDLKERRSEKGWDVDVDGGGGKLQMRMFSVGNGIEVKKRRWWFIL